MTDLKAWANNQREYWLEVDQKARAAGNRSESLDANGRMQAYSSVIDKIDAMQAESPSPWTPIEDAGEWDGEMEVQFRAVDKRGVIYWRGTTDLSYLRDEAATKMWERCRFYVYPAPPPFNPSDCEVKP